MAHLTKASVVLVLYIALVLSEHVNVLIIMDEGNKQAENGVEAGFKFLEKNLGHENSPSIISLDEQDARESIEKVCARLDTMIDGGNPPDLVLDLTLGGVKSEVTKSISLSLGLPTVTSTMGEEGDIIEWNSLTDSQQKYLIQVRSPSDMFQYIIQDLSVHSNISNAVIMFDDTFVMTHHYKNLLVNLPVRHILTKIEPDDDMLKMQIERMLSMDISNFFILAREYSYMRVLRMAESMTLYGDQFSWFIGTKNMDDSLDATCCTDMKIIFFYPKKSDSGQMDMMRGHGLTVEPLIESAFYADLTSKAVSAVSQMKEGGSWPAMTYTKCGEFNDGTPIERNVGLLSNLQNSGVADIWGKMMISHNGESHMSFMINVLHQKVEDSSLVESNQAATWTAGMPSMFDWVSMEMEDKVALFKAKKKYRVVSVIQPPFMQWNDTKKTYEGYTYDLMEEVSQILDFEWELYISPDDEYGEQDEDGNWNGVIGEIINRRADIGLGAISVMAEREAVIDFTVPFYDLVGITILMKKAKMPTNLFKFLSVLEDSVWACILGAYFITSVLLWIFDRWSPYSYQNNMETYEDDDETRYFNLKESLWFCMTSLTPQGGGEAPKNLSGRMVAATWWLFGFIIIASYTANLAAFLTVSRLEVPVGSLDDLIKQYKIQYAPVNGSVAAKYFQRMAYIEERFYEVWKDLSLDDTISEYERSKLAVWDYPVTDKYTKILQTMEEANFPQSFEEALERVRHSPSQSSGFALIADATDVRYQELITCDLQMVGDEFSRKPYALAVQQGSPLKDQLNDAVLRLLNQRKLEGMKERWWNRNENRKNCDADDEDTGGISIHNIGGVFIVIFVGIIIALMVLGVEYWYYKFKATPKDQVKVGPETKKVAEYDGKKGQKGENNW